MSVDIDRIVELLNKSDDTQTAAPADVTVTLMRKLNSRYLPDEPDPQEARWQALRDLADFTRRLNSGEYEAEREARRQAEAEAERVRQLPVAAQLTAALNRGPSSDPMPLNGPRVTEAVKRALR